MYNLFKCNKQITCTFPNQRHFPYLFTFFYRNTLKLAPFKNNENHQETSLQQNRSLVSKEKGIKILSLTRRIKSSSLISTQRFTVTRSWTRIDRTETQRERRGELTGTISAHRSVPMPRRRAKKRGTTFTWSLILDRAGARIQMSRNDHGTITGAQKCTVRGWLQCYRHGRT